jgi:YidC/Oxa1 family membrane protein insertase
VDLTGFEPVTFRVQGERSSQLSYRPRVLLKRAAVTCTRLFKFLYSLGTGFFWKAQEWGLAILPELNKSHKVLALYRSSFLLSSKVYFMYNSFLMNILKIFEVILIAPIVNLLMLFYKLFSLIGLPGTLGFAIIAVTALTRLAINPFMKKQIEQSAKMQQLQPKLAKLQQKYKKDPAKLQQAQMALYKENKINPGSGCLIFLIQMPLFIGLYNALIRVVSNSGELANLKNINNLLYSPVLKTEGLNLSFLHLNLTKTPAEWQVLGWWYLLIPVITGGLQLAQAYLSGRISQPIKKSKVAPTKKNQKKGKSDDPLAMQQAMQKQMLFIFPLMIGWFSFRFPVGLALYWNVFNIFGIWQYWQQAKAINPTK